MEQQEKRSFGKIGTVIGIAALILAFFVASTIVSHRREQAYNRAIEAIVAGDYDTGLSILESSLPETYKEKENLIRLCRAKQHAAGRVLQMDAWYGSASIINHTEPSPQGGDDPIAALFC